MDSCVKGDLMPPAWTMAGPNIDQDAGTLGVLAFDPAPGTDTISGTGELLDLTATTLPYPDVWYPEAGQAPLSFDLLTLSDDWGDPIEMSAVSGGISLKPFSYLELSDIPSGVPYDPVDPTPIPLTITAYGDVDELLSQVATQLELYLETTVVDEWGRTWIWRYNNTITPTGAQLASGTWTGDIKLFEPDLVGSGVVAKWGDFWGRSNQFYTLLLGDANGDFVIDILDVVKIANMAIDRGTWEDWQLVAADMNGDGVVDVADVLMCADAAMGAMEAMAAPLIAAQAEPVVVTTTITGTKTQTMLSVELSDCADLAGIQLDVAYDASRVSYAGMSAGDLLAGTTTWALSANDKGALVKAIAYTPSRETLPGGEGTILTFTFDNLGKKSGKAELTSVKLCAPGGVEIPSQIGPGKGKDKGGGKK
jgi:hypothetical protein